MKFLLLLVAIPFLAADCSSHKKATEQNASKPGNIADSIPACVKTRIDSIRSLPPWNPPAEVNEYSYMGRKVYLFTADCCDQFNMLFDDSCRAICAPSGGFTGKGDGKCPDFQKDASFIRLIWKDPR